MKTTNHPPEGIGKAKSTPTAGQAQSAKGQGARASQDAGPGQRSQGTSTAQQQSSRPQKPSSIAGAMVAPVPPQDDGSRESRIAREAYFRAERRGFQPGQELDDWLEAEKEFEKNRQH
jgi:hypothetical protein